VNAPNRLVARLAAAKRAGERGVAPFVTAGDGGLSRTLAVLRALDRAGASCAELGLPFSDPIADGAVLQAAADRALAAGTTFAGVCEVLRALRAGDARHAASELPIAIMSYSNPLLVRGLENSARELANAGADAWLVADVPLEEGDELRRAGDAAGLATIAFVSPTTDDARLANAARHSRGFLYAIGRFGVTGTATDLDDAAQNFLARARTACGELPLAVGFGIDSATKVRAAVRHADLAIVGSALVEHVHRAGGDDAQAAEAAEQFVRALRDWPAD
jgi:tryptophan synthase alpha chain